MPVQLAALLVNEVVLVVELLVVCFQVKIASFQGSYSAIRLVFDLFELGAERRDLDLVFFNLILRHLQLVEELLVFTLVHV